jgi:hypothetical protein
MADLRLGARGLISPGADGEDTGAGGASPGGGRWDRLPAFIAACFVLVPATMVPVMGFGAIATSSNGIGWILIAGLLATAGTLGVAAILAGAATALAGTRRPIPALLVAGGTTLALLAGILLVPVLMAGLAA